MPFSNILEPPHALRVNRPRARREPLHMIQPASADRHIDIIALPVIQKPPSLCNNITYTNFKITQSFTLTRSSPLQQLYVTFCNRCQSATNVALISQLWTKKIGCPFYDFQHFNFSCQKRLTPLPPAAKSLRIFGQTRGREVRKNGSAPVAEIRD